MCSMFLVCFDVPALYYKKRKEIALQKQCRFADYVWGEESKFPECVACAVRSRLQ